MASKNEKGHFLEDVVAQLHSLPGVVVRKNVGIRECCQSGALREFDVVVDVLNSNCESERFYIECKNYDAEIGIEHIDQFVGKLNAIGELPKNGVFVSAKGFKRSVAQRAKERGISVWEINGLNNDGFGKIAGKAYFNQLILLLVVESISSFDFNAGNPLTIRDKDGNVVNNVPNVIYQNWCSGVVSREIGSQTFKIEQDIEDTSGLPKDLLGTYIIEINVLGILLTQDGEYYQYDLVDSLTKDSTKTHFNAKFYRNEKLKVNTFHHKADLHEFMKHQQGTFNINQSPIIAPRIQFINAYYPYSKKVTEKLIKLQADGERPTFEKLEGYDLSTLWDFK